jgi:SMC interacting uncharacterized protein involved in chromosome segregation
MEYKSISRNMEINPSAETASNQSTLVQEKLNSLMNFVNGIERLRDKSISVVQSKRTWIDDKKLEFSELIEKAKKAEEAHKRKVKALKKQIYLKEKEIKFIKARISPFSPQTDHKEDNVVTTDQFID